MKKLLEVVFLVMCLAPWVSAATYEDGIQRKSEGQLAEAEQIFLDILKQTPTHTQAREQLALVQGWQNKYDLAISNWREVLVQQPENASARIGLARVLYWKGEHQEALQHLDQVNNRDGQNVDAWILQGDVQMAAGDVAGAKESYVHAQGLQPDDPALAKKIAGAIPPKAWRMDAGVITDRYSQDRDNEQSHYLQLAYTTPGKTSVYAKLEQFEQFKEKDNSWGVGVYWSPTKSLLINPEWNSAGNSADFRPKTQWGVQVDWLATEPVHFLLGYRLSDYDNSTSEGEVKTWTPGLRFVMDQSSIELRHGRTQNLDDSTTSVSSAKWSWEGEEFRPYLMYTNGKEATPPLDVADISVVSAGLVWSLSKNLGFRVDVAEEDRKGVYRHTILGVGISTFF